MIHLSDVCPKINISIKTNIHGLLQLIVDKIYHQHNTGMYNLRPRYYGLRYNK